MPRAAQSSGWSSGGCQKVPQQRKQKVLHAFRRVALAVAPAAATATAAVAFDIMATQRTFLKLNKCVKNLSKFMKSFFS